MLGVGGLGVIIPDVADVLLVPMCYSSTSLAYVGHVRCLASEFIYTTSIVVLYFIGIIGFDALLYCVYAFDCDVYVGMFK
jgi:hypothetical protein